MTTISTGVVIGDEHPIFRRALAQVIVDAVPGADILEVGDFDDVERALVRESKIDLALLDLAMPGVRGPSGPICLRAERPEMPVVVVSAIADYRVVRRCIDFGASGVVPKTTSFEEMQNDVRIPRVRTNCLSTLTHENLGAGASCRTTANDLNRACTSIERVRRQHEDQRSY